MSDIRFEFQLIFKTELFYYDSSTHEDRKDSFSQIENRNSALIKTNNVCRFVLNYNQTIMNRSFQENQIHHYLKQFNDCIGQAQL